MKPFLIRFAPCVLIILVAGFGLLSVQNRTLKRAAMERSYADAMMEKEIFEAALGNRIRSAAFLAKLTELYFAEFHGDRPLMTELNQEFLAFAENRPEFDQIRFLDATGQERVRVNASPKGPYQVSAEKLQNKGSRYYFQNGFAAPGVYLSKFDLNKEQGQVEVPHKPMLRITAPVGGAVAHRGGIIVLNYLGDTLLQRVRKAAEKSAYSFYLVNPMGYWLLGPAPEDAWGFMFPDGEDKTMAARFPEAWEKIRESSFFLGNNEAHGQFLTDQGMFTFVSISPQAVAHRSNLEIVSDEAWALVVFAPQEQLSPPWRGHLYFAMLMLIALAGVASWIWTESRVKAAAQARTIQENEEQFWGLFESSRDALFLLADGRFSGCNASAVEAFGVEGKDDIIGKRPTDFSPEQQPDGGNSQEMLDAYIAKALEFGSVFYEWRHEKRNQKGDETFFAEVLLSAVQLQGKAILQMAVRDISRRKQVEESLADYRRQLEARVASRTKELEKANTDMRESEELFRGITAVAQSAIILMGRDRTIVFWNAMAETLFGYDDEAAKQLHFDQLLSSEQKNDHSREKLEFFLTKGQGAADKTLELNALRKNGETFAVDISLSAMQLNSQRHVLALINDISERRHAEEEMRRNMAELEKFTSLTVDREERMIQLKEEINALRLAAGKDKKYKIVK